MESNASLSLYLQSVSLSTPDNSYTTVECSSNSSLHELYVYGSWEVIFLKKRETGKEMKLQCLSRKEVDLGLDATQTRTFISYPTCSSQSVYTTTLVPLQDSLALTFPLKTVFSCCPDSKCSAY